MGELNDEKLKMMEDEMNRFEEEIGLPNLPLPPSSPSIPVQTVIGANTFSQVQAQLRKIENEPGSIVPPPPPPPPPMFVPPQVQRMGPPMNMSMDGSGPPPMPPMPFGPPRGFPMPGPMGFGPPMGPMPPMGPGPGGPRPMPHMGPPGGPMGPNPMGPGGPMGPMGPGMGPMGPGPGHMGPGGPMGHMGPRMGPIGPGGPGMGPGGPPAGPINPMGPPGSGPMMGPGPGFIPPPPEFVQAKVQSSQGPVVVSRAPKKYSASGVEESMKPVTVGPEYPAELAEEKKSKKQKSSAKEMAEKVKASAVVSVVHEQGSQQQPNQKKKDKKNKKFIRTAGGQTWEDASLMEWEEDDFRLFCGDLGNDVTDEVLTRAFSKYTSFLKAKVVRDKRTNKTKGFGFVSFKDPQDFIRATKEMNGK
ncbi:RNA-binding protein 42 [Homalodisca vitripennis]|nr:RNA-binding protein 42 [Homalodisca vitripennis]